MDKISWIKELVLAEQQMEESGMVDFSAGFDPERTLQTETIEFLKDLKTGFVETASAFNQLKGSTIGNIKIYGISKTQADFMLFRNGYKLIFTMIKPGVVAARVNHIGSTFLPHESQEAGPDSKEEATFTAKWGAFGDLDWFFKDQPIKLDYLVRYFLTRFIRESAK